MHTRTHAHTNAQIHACTHTHTHVRALAYTRTYTLGRCKRRVSKELVLGYSSLTDAASLDAHARSQSFVSRAPGIYTYTLLYDVYTHTHTHTRTRAHTNNASSTPIEFELHTLLYDVYLLLVSGSVGL